MRMRKCVYVVLVTFVVFAASGLVIAQQAQNAEGSTEVDASSEAAVANGEEAVVEDEATTDDGAETDGEATEEVAAPAEDQAADGVVIVENANVEVTLQSDARKLGDDFAGRQFDSPDGDITEVVNFLNEMEQARSERLAEADTKLVEIHIFTTTPPSGDDPLDPDAYDPGDRAMIEWARGVSQNAESVTNVAMVDHDNPGERWNATGAPSTAIAKADGVERTLEWMEDWHAVLPEEIAEGEAAEAADTIVPVLWENASDAARIVAANLEEIEAERANLRSLDGQALYLVTAYLGDDVEPEKEQQWIAQGWDDAKNDERLQQVAEFGEVRSEPPPARSKGGLNLFSSVVLGSALLLAGIAIIGRSRRRQELASS